MAGISGVFLQLSNSVCLNWTWPLIPQSGSKRDSCSQFLLWPLRAPRFKVSSSLLWVMTPDFKLDCYPPVTCPWPWPCSSAHHQLLTGPWFSHLQSYAVESCVCQVPFASIMSFQMIECLGYPLFKWPQRI